MNLSVVRLSSIILFDKDFLSSSVSTKTDDFIGNESILLIFILVLKTTGIEQGRLESRIADQIDISGLAVGYRKASTGFSEAADADISFKFIKEELAE